MLLRSVLSQVFRHVLRRLTAGLSLGCRYGSTLAAFAATAPNRFYFVNLLQTVGVMSLIFGMQVTFEAQLAAQRCSKSCGGLVASSRPPDMSIRCRSDFDLRWNMFEDPATPAVLAYAICLCKGVRLRAIFHYIFIIFRMIFRLL